MDDEATRAKLLADLLLDALEGPTSRITKLNPKLLAARIAGTSAWKLAPIIYALHS